MAKALQRSFEKQGMTVHVNTKVENVRVKKDKVELSLVKSGESNSTEVEAESLLIAIGVSPNLEGAISSKLKLELERGYVNVNDTEGGLFHHHVLRWPELRAELRDDRRGVGYYRRNASEDAWLRNLAAYRADVLVVSPLPGHAREGAYVRDPEGFPLERTWADTHPSAMRPVVTTGAIRIYDLR